MKIFLTLGLLLLLSSSNLWAQDAHSILENMMQQQREQGNLQEGDVTFLVTNDHVSAISGIHHIYYRQTVNGIPIIGTESDIHMKDGKVFKQFNGFIPNARQAVQSASPGISAKNAIERAALSEQYIATSDFVLLNRNLASNTFVYSDGGISLSEIPVALVYVKTDNGILLAWDLAIQEKAQEHWYNMQIDAATGAVMYKFDWMTQCNFEHNHNDDLEHEEYLNYNENLLDAPSKTKVANDNLACTECYEVFALPLESPFFGDRTIEVLPANDIASPFGWHDVNGVDGAEFTTTRGNNTNTYEDGDNQDFQPEGSTNLDFSGFPFSQAYSPANQSEEAAITNLFYWTNSIHDVLYQYGFDAVSGNFQENNYGQGGAGSDSVNAEAQDGSGTCNANFGTPPEGANPQMQMFICGDRDGDFDNLVVVHEYGHGISTRLTGGAGNSGCLQGSEQMGEGWSDYYGVMLTMTVDDLPEDARPVGTYLFNQGPTGNGIRAFPYSTDLSVNPHTYDDIMTAALPHGVGSVWAEMLWEMSWSLIGEHGFSDDFMTVTGDVNLDAGNIQALLLVTEGLKLQPCAPGFVDGRDAILAADVAIYGGANECLIWDAFAKRGLGLSADQGSSASRTDGTEAFDTPSGFANFIAPDDLCESELIITDATGGTPFGGVYSGPGVTDNGDGSSYTFDPAAAGVGVHTIVYDVPQSICAIASIDSDTIEVFAAPDAPTTTDALLVCLNEEVTVTAVLNDPINVINWYDAPEDGNLLATGESYTFVPTENTVAYAQEGPLFTESTIVVTELSLQFPDVLEITNIGAAKDYTGYRVVLSDQPYANFNTVNPIVQDLGFMQENSAIFFDDVAGSPNYWGFNIWWGEAGNGWVLILDPDDNVVESVFWNATVDQIASLDINVGGVNITAADIEWTGVGADFDEVCTSSFRRVGENDDASNWASDCLDSDYGVFNSDMQLGFQGCFPARVPALVTGEEEAPIIVCPDNVVIAQETSTFEVPDYTLDATASDNCSFTITQDPAPGSVLDIGSSFTVTLTVTDSSGNSTTCEFILDSVLGIDETTLDTSISLFPNPTSGNVNLTYNGDTLLDAIQVIDVNGRLIKTVTPSLTETTNINIEEVATGFYFVKITAGSTTVIKQVIKN